MKEEILALPSPGDDFINLSGGGEERMLRKRILPMNGSFVHPANPKTKIFVDSNMAKSLVDNFKKGICEIVQVPIVNSANQHTEDPRDNAGRVVGLDYDNTGVYATIKASKYAEDFGKTILGASAFLHLNYMNTATGERVGPTLLHVAATNRPHVNGLGEYEELIKASADISDDEQILFLSEEESQTEDETPEAVDETVEEQTPTESETPEETEKEDPMTKEEMLAALKAEHGIDVEALQGDATKVAELSAQLDDVNAKLELSGATVNDIEDLAKSYVELSNAHKTLSSDIATLKEANATYEKRDAEHKVDALVRAGRVLPAQRDVMVALSMKDPETFEALVPENPIVKLSEEGVTLHEDPNAGNFDADITRYKEMALRLSRPSSVKN